MHTASCCPGRAYSLRTGNFFSSTVFVYIRKMDTALADECVRRARSVHDVSRITCRQRTGTAAKHGKFPFRGLGGRKRAVASKMIERLTPTAQGADTEIRRLCRSRRENEFPSLD